MAEIKLPFVNSYPRNGRMRHQFRRKGCRRFRLKGKVGSAEFMAHYAKLLAANEGPSPSRARPDTINALIGEYLEHATFKGLAETTRASRRGILINSEFETPSGRPCGDNTLKGIEGKHFTAVIEGKPITVQRDWLKALRHWIAFFIKKGKCKRDPTVVRLKSRPKFNDINVRFDSGDESKSAPAHRLCLTLPTRKMTVIVWHFLRDLTAA